MCDASRSLTILILFLGFAFPALSATYSYRLTEIPLTQVPSLGVAHGHAINDAGHVTGGTHTCNGDGCWTEAFLWRGNSTTLFRLLPSSPTGEFSYGADINNLGQVAGYFSNLRSGGELNQAFFWDGETKQLLGTFGGNTSAATSINGKGQVTGHSYFADNTHHAFLWDGVTMRDLGTLGGGLSNGTGINNVGHVTGTAGRLDLAQRAFLWNGTSMKSLGTLGGSWSHGLAINSSDHVVGASETESGRTHAFIWRNGLMEDLGVLSIDFSRAHAINNAGQVVGYSGPPFLWENGTMRNINSLVAGTDPLKPLFRLRDVHDINNVGQIIGVAQSTSDSTDFRAYLISPAYKLSAFLMPTIRTWRRASTVRIAIAVLDDNRARIPDQRAKALQAVSCRVKVSATGAQTLASTCMKYDPATNEFWLDWNLAGTGTGTATIDVRVNYGAPGPLKVRRTKSISVSN